MALLTTMNDAQLKRFIDALADMRGKLTVGDLAFNETARAMNIHISSRYISVDPNTGISTLATPITDTFLASDPRTADLNRAMIEAAFSQLTLVNIAYTGTPLDRTPRDIIYPLLDIT